MKTFLFCLLATTLLAQTHVGVFADKSHPTVKVGATPPSVSLSCTGSTGAVSYNFYRSTGACPGTTYTILGTSPMVNSCSYTDLTVAPGSTYCYVATDLNIAVGATCPTGAVCESGYSNTAQAAVPYPAPPAPPTNLTVGTIVGNEVPLLWDWPIQQTGVTVKSCNVWRGKRATMPSPQKIGTAVAPSYTDFGCPGTCFYEVNCNDEVNGAKATTAMSNVAEAQIH